jgi:hypothetical protein
VTQAKTKHRWERANKANLQGKGAAECNARTVTHLPPCQQGRPLVLQLLQHLRELPALQAQLLGLCYTRVPVHTHFCQLSTEGLVRPLGCLPPLAQIVVLLNHRAHLLLCCGNLVLGTLPSRLSLCNTLLCISDGLQSQE